jgi:hypothetical protein
LTIDAYESDTFVLFTYDNVFAKTSAHVFDRLGFTFDST